MALIFILLYAPILTLIVLSFNSSKTRAKWGGFTLKWYSSLFANDEIMNALYTTLVIALVASAVATLLGTMAAIGMNSMKKRSRTIFTGITNIPMLNGEIVMGISLMLLFIICKIQLGFGTILLAHITFNIPYVILSVMPKLKQTSKTTYEAALDLGASPLYAFWKIVFPDIMPGVTSGFLLAFTMSLDDFVITYFTKGPGVDTLSTKIYSEVRKGIKPEMYSLSTILFVTVLVLLILVNVSPSDKSVKESENKDVKNTRKQTRIFSRRMIFGRIIPVLIVLVIAGGGIYYGSKNVTAGDNQLIVYNWGEYMDPEVIDLFEEETGIHVIYEEYETNEIMYPKIKSGAVAYDLVCPSDYMIQKMIQNDLLMPINFDHIPNAVNIGNIYYQKSEEFDPGNLYSIPYCWGTVGILYNKTMVDEPVDSWSILWDTNYRDSILMQDSVRDAFAVALKSLGYSLNSTNIRELTEAKDLLITQKPLVQAYVIDQVRDKMIGNEAALGVIYSGEAIFTQQENPDLEYVVPKEGSNVWIDSWCIPKNAQHVENAEQFLNFLCRPDIALMNFEYITYSTPNESARKLIDDPEIRDSQIAFPDDSILDRCETFTYLGEDVDEVYNQLWREVKSH
ncbi:MAG: extracellular solute-binding protein [Fusicatenibacter sp.]|nr:extracellular solute-binding protein [Fusicatenibacter sp.]